MWTNSDGIDEVYLSNTNPYEVLIHEVGHLVHKRYLNVQGVGCWVYGNDLSKEYLLLKQYPHCISKFEQFKLPWEERAIEWFAEDFAQWINPNY